MADPGQTRTCSKFGLGSAHGPPQRTRRELPLPGELRAAAARLRRDRARPGDDPGRLLLRGVQGRARAPDRRRPDVPPQAQAGPARHRPPGLGQRRRLRHRPARAPDGAAVARWRARARRPVRPHGRHPAGPLAAAVGVRGHRGPASRARSRSSPRCTTAPSTASPAPTRSPSCAASSRTRRRWRRRPRASWRRVRRATPSCSRAACVTNLAKPVAAGQAGRADGRRAHQDHRPRPQRHGDGRAADRAAHLVQRHHHRAPHGRHRRPVAGQDQGDQERRRRAPPSTTSCSRVSGGALRRYLEERGELPETSLLASVPVSVRGDVEEAGRQQQGLHDLLPARHRHRGPARAAARRSPRATPTPRTTTRRSRPTRCRTGPSSPPRAPSASPCGWSPRSGSPTPAR